MGYDNNKMIVIPNGFDLARFTPSPEAGISVRDEFHLGKCAKLVGLVARFDPQKNHKGFFEAASLIHQKRPDIHFLLAGEGIEASNPELWKYVEQAEIQNVTHLLGCRKDVPRLMAALDVLASSSSYGEAFPNVLGEAMACGAPCVVTDVGDSAQIVGNTGRVVRIGDMEALAKRILELLAMDLEQRRALGMKARLRIKENFDVRKITLKYEQYFLGLAGQS